MPRLPESAPSGRHPSVDHKLRAGAVHTFVAGQKESQVRHFVGRGFVTHGDGRLNHLPGSGIIERGQLLMHGSIQDVYRRIRGNRIIEVKFIDGMDVGLSIIRSSPYCRDVQVQDHQVVVELETDDRGVAEVLQQLVDQKAGIRSFGEKDPSLEDVFMMVTKGLVT